MYASERHQRFYLEQDVDSSQTDIERMSSFVDELKKEIQDLRTQLAITQKGDCYERCEKLAQQNQDLQNQVDSLTNQLIDLKKVTRDSDSLLDRWQKEKEDMEQERITFRSCIKELEICCEEGKKRIDVLHEECRSLSTKLNDSMELMEKYKTGYTNLKRRMDTSEKTKVVMTETTDLSPSSISHQLILGKDSFHSPTDELNSLKDDILENEAYNIVILQLSCEKLTEEIITTLYHIIEDGYFPRLRIIDLYSKTTSFRFRLDCVFDPNVHQVLSEWLHRFLFIDVLAPCIMGPDKSHK